MSQVVEDNCCFCGESADYYDLSISAVKQWVGWLPFGYDPDVDLITTKYRHAKIEIDRTPEDPELLCIGGETEVETFHLEAEYEYDQTLLQSPAASGYGFSGEGYVSSGYTSWNQYNDGSIDSGASVKYEKQTTDCGGVTETNPYSAYGNWIGYPWPDDCDDPATANIYAVNFWNSLSSILSDGPDVTTVVSDTVMTMEWTAAGLVITITLSESYTKDQLLADCATLLALVDFGDTVLVGEDDAYTSETISDSGLRQVTVRETQLCASGSQVQAFSCDSGALLSYFCDEGHALKHWDASYAYMTKSRIVLAVGQTACQLSTEITKATTSGYTCGTRGCDAAGLTGTITVEPADITTLGTITVSPFEPCAECP